MTYPVRPGLGTQPLGTSSFGWPGRDVVITVGRPVARRLTARLEP